MQLCTHNIHTPEYIHIHTPEHTQVAIRDKRAERISFFRLSPPQKMKIDVKALVTSRMSWRDSQKRRTHLQSDLSCFQRPTLRDLGLSHKRESRSSYRIIHVKYYKLFSRKLLKIATRFFDDVSQFVANESLYRTNEEFCGPPCIYRTS